MVVITEFPAFTPITPSIMPETVELAHGYEHYADFNPVVLWCWNRGYPGGVSHLNGNLVIKWKDPTTGAPYLSFTSRHACRQTATTLLDYADHHGLAPCLRAVPTSRTEVDAFGSELTVCDDRDNFEYLLSVDDWVQLRGAEFRNMRNSINKLERRLDISTHMPSLGDEQTRSDIDRLCTRWARQRGLTKAQFLPEQTAIRNLFDHIPSTTLFVLGAYVDDRLVGFSINESQDNGVGIGHFAKADYAHPGLFPYMLHHVCIHLQDLGMVMLNIEQDLGVPGLRTAKQLLRPVNLLEKVMICRNARPWIVPAPPQQWAPLPTGVSAS